MKRKQVAMISIDRDLIDTLHDMDEFEIVGVFDPNPDATSDLPILGSDEDWAAYTSANKNILAVLAVDPCQARRRLATVYGLDSLVTIIGSGSYVSTGAEIKRGTIVQRGAIISAGVIVGQACKINIGATVHHDCHIADFCVLAPGARLLGNVTLGEAAYIGAGAIILPRLRIGANAVVGAGAVVTRDVAPDTVVMGTPARENIRNLK